MSVEHIHNPTPLNEDRALRTILEGTATVTGQDFFRALVDNLANALGVYCAMVTEYIEETRELRALAFRIGNEWRDNYVYPIANTPCEKLVDEGHIFHYPEGLQKLFPNDGDLGSLGLDSYLAVPLMDLDEKVLGTLAVLDTRPMPEEPNGLALFRIFAARAAAELQRERAEKQAREREQQLGRLVESAMDAIIRLDATLRVELMNPAAEAVFNRRSAEVRGNDFATFLSTEGGEKLRTLAASLAARPEGRQYLWIPGGLHGLGQGGNEFPAEATLSHYKLEGRSYFSLILRNVRDRVEAEQQIQTLTEETAYLREELRELSHFDEIVGESPALMEMLRELEQVAGTDATVLVLGESGTGKELIARAIHRGSPRAEKRLVKVNCAAIPASLMESEFFGHEKGAFTGATDRREGRFALAHGGTIFLDEIGELPLDLQAKLLRVLQEGEFEPVGSALTKTVDVRVVAATNRDLKCAVEEGKFREDLFYRLNVFPVQVPPLRERGDDIVLLARTFAQRYAQRLGRAIDPLDDSCCQRLRAYSWPGNVRELQNIVERAVITARGGKLNLERALPDLSPDATTPIADASNADEPRIRTVQELQELEKRNIVLALEACGWRVSGEGGAAKRLGMKPSTLSSRIKALGIKKS